MTVACYPDAEQRTQSEIVGWGDKLKGPPKQGEVADANVEKFAHEVGAVSPGKSARDNPMWAAWMKYRRSL